MPSTVFTDIVFALTPSGYAALRNTTAPMALPLKTVLTMIDGVCPVAQYLPFMRTFDPLVEKFQILESLGYVRRAGSVSSAAVSTFERSVKAGFSVSQLPAIDSHAQDSGFAPE
jgi:hypothetical protein